MKSAGRGLRAALALAVIAAIAIGPAATAAPVTWAQTQQSSPFSGTATGTVIHLDALENGGTRVADAEVAHAAAAVKSNTITSTASNEMGKVVVDDTAQGHQAYATGTGLEVGVLVAPDVDGQILLQNEAESFAAPTTAPVTAEIVTPDLDPVAYASLLRGQAATKFSPDYCTLGDDISRGIGYAADAQLVGLGPQEPDGRLGAPVVATDDPHPERGVSQSLARERLVPQRAADGTELGDPANPGFGLMSEVRQTIAPIRLLDGTTVELLGEWVLRVVATGLPGGAYVHYGPGSATPSTPVVRILDSAGVPSDILTLQDVLTDTGLNIPVPGVADITIGEAPRAIGGAYGSAPAVAGDGTSASAAVDVVRIKLLEQLDDAGAVTLRAAELRVGHMEVSATVPAGGIACQVPVTKTANPANVGVGESFNMAIDIFNPFDCDLTNVRLEDVITTPDTNPSTGAFQQNLARFQISVQPQGAEPVNLSPNLDGTTVVWPQLGPIAKGGQLRVTMTQTAQGGGGHIDDVATAKAVLANCTGDGAGIAGTAIGLEKANVAGVASYVERVGQVLGARLARTGPVASTIVAGLMVIGLAYAIRRRVVRARV